MLLYVSRKKYNIWISMQFATGRYDVDQDFENHPYAAAAHSNGQRSIDAPLWMNPDGSLKKGSCWERFRYAPYGMGMMPTYAREITANALKEGVGIILITFLLPGFVATPVGADPVSRAIFVGLVAALSLFGVLNWGYNDRLPRFLTPGSIVVELLDGSINWVLALIFLVVGFLFATIGAGILYSTGTSAIPIIGAPNPTSTAGVFFVQLLFTGAIALTVMDQFTTKRGRPRTFGKRTRTDNSTPDDAEFPNKNRVYREDIGARPIVYCAFVWVLVSFAFLKYGLFTFNAYIYYAGALGSQFLGASNAFNNVGLGGAGTYVGGAGALFILVDILAWVLAWALNILLYYLHNNEPRPSFDDSSYGNMKKSKRKVNTRMTADMQPRRVQSAAVTQRRPIETRADFAQDLATYGDVPMNTVVEPVAKFNASAWTTAAARK